MHELGILDEFLRDVPHQAMDQLGIGVGGRAFDLIDFRHLPTACKYVVLAPQWDFLNFLAAKAKRYPSFRLAMNTEATGLLWENDRVVGVTAHSASGPLEIRADVTVACDGRWSVIREHSGLPVRDFPMPIDVLWFRLPRSDSAPETLGYIGGGQIVIAIDRGDYWQCGAIIDKGGFEAVQADGLSEFRSRIASAAPFLTNSLHSLTDWDQIKLLSVRANRMRKWWLPGLLCIGDAAHAMSPVGGIGVNYAIADAVAAANALAGPLQRGQLIDDDLRAVQKRRQPPTKVAQMLQRAQTTNLARLRNNQPPLWTLRLLSHLGPVKRLLGRTVGLGLRREHVRTVAVTD
jgi:2-polyprenyl-6-methoxyphenol hydroxylase-like FAD-dependent oxidoreductase